MAKNIRIIQERIGNKEIDEAKKLIKEANTIFFLGFGYADENLNILGIPGLTKEKTIRGTAMGFTKNEINRIFWKVKRSSQIHEIAQKTYHDAGGKMVLEEHDCRTLLRNWL